MADSTDRSTDEATDQLAATLAGIRERYAEAARGLSSNPGTYIDSANDVPRLLKAVEAALKEHQPVNRGEDLEPICGTCHRGFWPCATHRAITVALAGEEAGDGN